MPDQYLSTDPSAGLTAPTGGYLSTDPQAGMPVFRQSDQTPNEVDPNTLGTFVKHLWAGVNPVQIGQLLPFPKAAGGSGADNPLNPVKIVNDLHAVKQDADARLKRGDYVGALSKYVESVVPVLGPMMSHMGDQAQAGKWAALGGDTAALAAQTAVAGKMNDALASPEAAQAAAGKRMGATMDRPNPVVQFAQQRGVPLDAATVSNNLAVKGAQAIADRSLGGSVVATPANAARAEAMTRVGGELADEAHPTSVTLEQAGQSVRDALTAKMAEHGQAANAAYDTLRELEQTPTDASAGATRSETTVKLQDAKLALRPIYDQMRRQMPVTQQQASGGLKAIQNIIEGPDFAPLSQVDRDLSSIKKIAREQGGLAKKAVSELDNAVTGAAAKAGPDVLDALKQGRQATIAKYAVSDVLDKMNAEPVRTTKALTAPADSAIQQLRAVVQHVPEQAQVLARAKLEDLLASPQAVSDWFKLGTETKKILFPREGQSAALDQFFALKDRISKTNVNPSGSGYVVNMVDAAHTAAQGAGLVLMGVNPTLGASVLGGEAALQLGGAAVSKAMRSPAFVNALTRGMRLPNTAPVAARAAATAAILNSARQAGVVIDFPKAADSTPPADTSR